MLGKHAKARPVGDVVLHARRTILVVGLLLVVAVAVAVAELVSLYRSIGSALVILRQAQNDNTTWLVAQSEVDLLKYRLALSDLRRTEDPDDVANVLRAFDIYYSRVSVIDDGLHQTEMLSDPAIADQWTLICDAALRHAAILDQGETAVLQSLALLSAQSNEAAGLTRTFAVNALQSIVNAAMRERENMGRLLRQFFATGAIMLLLMSALSLLLLVSLRNSKAQGLTLKRLSSTLSRAIEASPDAVLVTDASGRITNCNSAAEHLLGCARDRLQGNELGKWLLLDSDDARRRIAQASNMGDHQSKALLAGERERATMQRVDRVRLPVEITFSSVADSEDQDFSVLFARDISERLRAEETLRSARDAALQGEEAKARFLAVMSHEMRTPLSGVIAALDILQKSTRQSRRQKEFLLIARRCSETALEQIDDVLELTRLDDDRQTEEVERFDVLAALREISEQIRPVAEQLGNRLVLTLPNRDSLFVIGHKRLLARIVFNLLGNAVKFTSNGQVELRLHAEPDANELINARCEIIDTGIGVAANKLESIFSDFETIDKSYARRAEGTGLGLGIAKRAVEKMGGSIGVESVEGEGSCFWFRIPLYLAAPLHPRPDPQGTFPDGQAHAGTGQTNARILIAEDSPVNRRVLREMLLYLGCRIDEACNGLEAVKMAERTRYDLILMDISMPELSGVEAAARIRTTGLSRESRQIGITAHAMPSEIAAMHAAGLKEVIVKPVTINMLTSLLGNVQAPPDARHGKTPANFLFEVEYLDALSAIMPDTEFLVLVRHYLDETDDFLRQVRDAPSATIAAEIAHKIAGSCAVVGATAMRDLLVAFEASLRAGELPNIADRLAEIVACWQKTKGEFDRYMTADRLVTRSQAT